MPLTVDDVLERARRMRHVPTLYWIGMGGNVPEDDAVSPPGEEFVFERDKRRVAPERLPNLLAKATAAGIDLSHIPPIKACDCSGFAWWALRQPRHDRNTDWIWQDAQRPRPAALFELFDPTDRLRAAEGALIVYPKPPADFRNRHGEPDAYGHIGIVTAVDAQGRPTAVIHCSADNFLGPAAPRADGGPGERNAIAETGPEVFLDHAAVPGHETRVVWYRPLAR